MVLFTLPMHVNVLIINFHKYNQDVSCLVETYLSIFSD